MSRSYNVDILSTNPLTHKAETHYILGIRPLAVCPLIYPERVQNPWGFFFFSTFCGAAQ